MSDVCKECGFDLDSAEHIAGRGNIHNPDFKGVEDKKAKAKRQAEFRESVLADEAKRYAEAHRSEALTILGLTEDDLKTLAAARKGK